MASGVHSFDPMSMTSAAPVGIIRYGLRAALIAVGFLILFVGDDTLRWDGWSMCVGSGLALLLLNVLYRYGIKGDEERKDEEDAREYLAKHGHWPDEQ